MMIQALFTRSPLLMMVVLLPFMLIGCVPKPHTHTPPSPYDSAAQPHPYTQQPSAPVRQTQAPTTAIPQAGADATTPAFTGEEIPVALLLPLSGKSADLGNAILDAAMLGLFDKYASLKGGSMPRITLLPKDTAGDSKRAAKVAGDAIDEGAQLILGPLFSQSVLAVKPVAAQRGVNVISLSNNKAVAGGNSFLFGFMPYQQVNRVLETAQQNGFTRIGALLPDTEYGRQIEDTLLDFSAMQGLPETSTFRYNPSGNSIKSDVQRFTRQSTDMDALLLADNGEALTSIIAQLQREGLNNEIVKYLGTGVWDDAGLETLPEMQGSWFASAPIHTYNGFEARFVASEGYTPPRIASLGYDAVAFAATLAMMDGFDTASITQPSGFEGPANGIFRFMQDGTIERGLSVLEFSTGGIQEVSSSPRMFY